MNIDNWINDIPDTLGTWTARNSQAAGTRRPSLQEESESYLCRMQAVAGLTATISCTQQWYFRSVTVRAWSNRRRQWERPAISMEGGAIPMRTAAAVRPVYHQMHWSIQSSRTERHNQPSWLFNKIGIGAAAYPIQRLGGSRHECSKHQSTHWNWTEWDRWTYCSERISSWLWLYFS